MAETTKCAHPACSCQVTGDGEWGEFCSEHCKEADDMIELKCDCHHPGCK